MIADAARTAIAETGRFSLAISGGHTPYPMFRALDDHDLDWDHIDLFQVDERVAPDGDDDRNLTHMRESLPAAASERMRPMPVTEHDLEAAAVRYEAVLPKPHRRSPTSGSGPTGTRPPSYPVTRCWR